MACEIVLRDLPAQVAREFALDWRIVVRDLPTTVIPGTLFALSAWHTTRLPASDLAVVLGRAVPYFVLFVYAFCLVNQLCGVAEDKVNKPDRPYARDLVSAQWMRCRAVAALTGFGVLGIANHVIWPTLLWIALIFGYNLAGLHRHWVTKNMVFITLGTAAELSAAWGMTATYSRQAWLWITVLSILLGIFTTSQDMRDIAGDRVAGRRTAPIVFGESRTRSALVLLFLALPAVCNWLLLPTTAHLADVILLTAQYALCVLVAVRLALRRTPRSDHISYQLYSYWYCLMTAALLIT